MPHAVIAQDVSSVEVRAVVHAAMLSSTPVQVVSTGAAGIAGAHLELLRAPGTLAVGSVEFLRAAMLAAGVDEPAPMSYPVELKRSMGREIHQVTAGQARAGLDHWPWQPDGRGISPDLQQPQGVAPANPGDRRSAPGAFFVKPVATKLFTGFVFDPAAPAADLDEHDREQRQVFMDLPAGELVWVSPAVEFLCEWRIYVSAGAEIGRARYDADGEDDAPIPNSDEISAMINELSPVQPVALDVGVTSGGRTVLVEVNDAWAIGLYGKALTPARYTEFLFERWQKILSPAHNPAIAAGFADHPRATSPGFRAGKNSARM